MKTPSLVVALTLFASAAGAVQTRACPGLPHMPAARAWRAWGAYVGLAEGTDAINWNPAGLGRLRPNITSLMHTNTNEGLISSPSAMPSRSSPARGRTTCALIQARPQTNEFNQEVGRFSDVQQAIMVGYGISPFQALSLGGTFKFAQQSMAGSKASGWGVDIGVLGMLKHGLSWGVRVQNAVAPSLSYESGEDQFPRVVTAGVPTRLLTNRLVLTADTERAVGGTQTMKWRLGVEGTFLKVASLRAGFDIVDKSFNVGFGYTFGRKSVSFVNSANSMGSPACRPGLRVRGYEVVVNADKQTFARGPG